MHTCIQPAISGTFLIAMSREPSSRQKSKEDFPIVFSPVVKNFFASTVNKLPQRHFRFGGY